MARLISKPVGLGVSGMVPLSGPQAMGGDGGNTSTNGFAQTVSSPFGAWAWQFTFPVSKDNSFRRYRGWITALHGGANATRFPFFDADMMTPAEAGMVATAAQLRFGIPWGNGEPWSNGENWGLTAPNVQISVPAARDATLINLADQYWGRKLQVGDYIGFFPFHFGLYIVTQEFGDGQYRVWPPLRKAIDTSSFATLYPVLAMRLPNKDAASAERQVAYAPEKTVTLIEVFDYDVRDYFTE